MNDELYEQAAQAYAEHSARSFANAKYERPAMLALLGEVADKTVLDAGCAGGEYAAYLLEAGASVLALDRSPAMVEIVKKRFGSSIEARRHDLNEPLAWLRDGSVDVVVSSLTMHYIAEWDVPMREFCRVLKPSGKLLMSTHHPSMTAPLVENYFDTVLVKETWQVGGRDHDVTFYHRPLQSIVSAITNAGLTVRRVIEPRITQRAEGLSEEWFQRLSRQPWFLIIEAEKT